MSKQCLDATYDEEAVGLRILNCYRPVIDLSALSVVAVGLRILNCYRLRLFVLSWWRVAVGLRILNCYRKF